jgi:hypothetical protein
LLFLYISGSGWLAKLDGHYFIITNNHVIRNSTEADASHVIFDCKTEFQQRHGTRIQLDTNKLFHTNTLLDFSIVALRNGFSLHARLLKAMDLRSAVSVPDAGSVVEVYQHPQGESLRMSKGTVARIDQPYIRYSASTDYGSSGGLVINGNMEMVALHHARDTSEGYNRGILIQAIVQAIDHAAVLSQIPPSHPGIASRLVGPGPGTFSAQFEPFAKFIDLTPDQANSVLRAYLKSRALPLLGIRAQQVMHYGLLSWTVRSYWEKREVIVTDTSSVVRSSVEIKVQVPEKILNDTERNAKLQILHSFQVYMQRTADIFAMQRTADIFAMQKLTQTSHNSNCSMCSDVDNDANETEDVTKLQKLNVVNSVDQWKLQKEWLLFKPPSDPDDQPTGAQVIHVKDDVLTIKHMPIKVSHRERTVQLVVIFMYV